MWPFDVGVGIQHTGKNFNRFKSDWQRCEQASYVSPTHHVVPRSPQVERGTEGAPNSGLRLRSAGMLGLQIRLMRLFYL